MSDPYRTPSRPTRHLKIVRRVKEKLLAVAIVAALATFFAGGVYMGSDEFEENRIRRRTEDKAREVSTCIESCAVWGAKASFNPHIECSLECRCVAN